MKTRASHDVSREVEMLQQAAEKERQQHALQLKTLVGAHTVAIERLRAELTGTAAEQAAAREATARERRVEALAGKAMRRIQNAGLIRGWTAWLEQWETAAWQRRMLAGAAARLARPQLAACVAHWRAEWEAEGKAAAAQERQVERSAHAAQLAQVQAEVHQSQEASAALRLANLAAEDERAAQRAKLAAAR